MQPIKNDFACPCCGADVPSQAAVCPECGACEEFGWNEGWEDELQDHPDGYGDDTFDYEEYLEREFPEDAEPSPRAMIKKTAVAILIVLICLSLLAWQLFP